MTELKYGGNNVVKIMYGDQEIGGATKLEPGTILYIINSYKTSFENAHLLNTTKNWSNINGINVGSYSNDFSAKHVDVDISSDDFKNLDTEKEYTDNSGNKVTASISIVDGEYRLNVSTNQLDKLVIKAI